MLQTLRQPAAATSPTYSLPVYARGMATAVPPHEIRQDVMRDFMARGARIEPHRLERLLRVFTTTGVNRRYAAVALEDLHRLRRWPARHAAFVECADALLLEANCGALAAAGVVPEEVDIIVSVNTTGYVAPDLAARQIGKLGLRRDVRRVPLNGFGCAGGAAGLAQAADLARANPGALVLLHVVELCLLNANPDTDSETHLVASAFFGDGAASIVLSTDGPGLFSVGHGCEHCWPGTDNAMTWQPGDVGIDLTLAPQVPNIIRSEFPAVAEAFFDDSGIEREAITSYISHPGSLKIINAVEQSLSLAKGTLADTREVWANYGNMSAATVFFIMQSALDRGARGPYLMTAFGPGLTAALVEGEIAGTA